MYFKWKRKRVAELNEKLREQIMKKYTCKEQHDIIVAMRNNIPVKEVAKQRRRRQRLFKMTYIPMYELSKISEESIENGSADEPLASSRRVVRSKKKV